MHAPCSHTSGIEDSSEQLRRLVLPGVRIEGFLAKPTAILLREKGGLSGSL
jgi:hypothetical protein